MRRCAVARKQRRQNRVVSAATSRNHKKRKKPPPSDGNARVELDSHADGAVFGMDCRVINDTGTVVSVDGFDPVSMQDKWRSNCDSGCGL